MINTLIKPSFQPGEIHYFGFGGGDIQFYLLKSRTAKNVMFVPLRTIRREIPTTNYDTHYLFEYVPTDEILSDIPSFRYKIEEINGWPSYKACTSKYFGLPVVRTGSERKDHTLEGHPDILNHLRRQEAIEILQTLTDYNNLNYKIINELNARGITSIEQIDVKRILEISKDTKSLFNRIICWNDEQLLNFYLDIQNANNDVYSEQTTLDVLKDFFINRDTCQILLNDDGDRKDIDEILRDWPSLPETNEG